MKAEVKPIKVVDQSVPNPLHTRGAWNILCVRGWKGHFHDDGLTTITKIHFNFFFLTEINPSEL